MQSKSEVYTTKVFLNAEQAKKELEDLTKRVTQLQKERDKYVSQGDLKKVNEINKELKETTNRLNAMQTTSAKISKVLDNLSGASVKQIQSTIKAITQEMNSGRIKRGSEEWNYFEEQLQRCNKELRDIRSGIKGTTTESNTLGVFLRNTFANYSAYVLHDIQNLATQFVGNIRQMVDEGTELARSAEGIEAAFERINKPGLLDELRKATHGTVSDLELMQQAVKFKDFNLPVEQLGKYLAFAQQKSKDTGESIDYMVNSIVTGLGRQSKMILDNLGLSAKEIGDEVERSGNFFDAVATIVDKRMAEAGEHLETSMDRAAQASARLQNAQLEVGKALLPLKEQAGGAYTEIRIGTLEAIKWIYEHRKALLQLLASIVLVTAAYKSYNIWQKTVAAWNATLAFGQRALIAVNALLKASFLALEIAWARMVKTTIAYRRAIVAATAASSINPWVALLTVLSAVGVAIWGLVSAADKGKTSLGRMTTAQQEFNKASKEGEKNATAETSKLRTLYNATQDTTKSMEERRACVKQLQDQYPAYFKNLTAEQILAGKAADQYRQLASDIIAVAKARVYQERIEKLSGENADLEEKAAGDTDWLIRNEDRYNKLKSQRKTFEGMLSSGEWQEPQKRAAKNLDFLREYEKKSKEAVGLTGKIAMNEAQIQKFADKVVEAKPLEQKLQGSQDNTTDTDKNKKSGKTTKATDPYDAELKQLEASNKQRQYLLKEQHAYGLLSDEQYHQQQLASDMAFYQSKLQLQQRYGKDTVDTRNAILDKTISEEQYKEQQSRKTLQDQLKVLDDSYQSDRLELLKLYAEGEFKSKDEYDKRLLELERDHRQQLLNIIRAAGGDTIQVESDIAQQEIEDREKFFDQMKKAYENAFNKTTDLPDRQRLLQSMYDQNLISAEEYQERMTEIEEEGERQRDDIRQMFMQQAGQLMGDLSSLYSAMQEEEVAKLEARYQREIDSAKKAGRDTTKLEKEKEEKVNAIKRKYAEKEFRMKVLQIVADTAVGIAQLWKNPGYPWAIPLTAMVAASGAMQLATAQKAQQQALSTGYYSGGFTGGRRYRKEAGVVHEGEFVANHEAVNNPTILPALELIDRAQRRNLVSSLDLGKELGGNTTVVSAPTVNVNTDNSSLDHTLAGITEAVKRLNDRLDEGIEAYSVIDGPNGSYNKLSEYKKLLSHK